MAVDEIVFCSGVSPFHILVDGFFLNEGGMRVGDIELEFSLFYKVGDLGLGDAQKDGGSL